MNDGISTTEGFIDYCIDQRANKKSFLLDVDCLIDWKPIERLLTNQYKKRQAADGRPAYPPLTLFKMLLIQRWYNLSDPGLEEAVNDRLSFPRFTGFSFESSIPDETTIYRFRNELTQKGLYKKLLGRINAQLEAHNILVSKTRNRLISRLRYTVEQGFGTLKRRYRFDRARYLGILKIEMEFYLNAMAFNLRKAAAMLA
ncbi:MAG: transposase [Thermodesulfobacteriota bacterium]